MSESITTSWKEIYTKTVNYATYHVWAKVESQSVSKNSSVVRTSMIIPWHLVLAWILHLTMCLLQDALPGL